ncbi:hypothetical protein [Micromonospora sp. WMMD975]|uniref:hypothetical protein n=1 Tax=Micromonospora sp. WMMD975 TaxID=3016087 RepID=UPI00249BB6CC|nr:hypothetical protein [Micromonospora sp. WMMD975]WFE34250.1 hypothetical protein O7613_02300 [Micromonospora sp. WMMD975]
MLAVTAENVFDVFEDYGIPLGHLAMKTDGRWVWPADLSHYVCKYNIQLPERFLDWIRSVDWIAPELSQEELLEVEEDFLG